MSTVVIPDEQERLSLLHAYRLLDTPPDPLYDELVQLAAQLCDAQFAAITFLDAERVWLKARIGFPITELPRKGSYCDWTVQNRELMVIEDATCDPRLKGDLLCLDGTPLRFYVGIPLELKNGLVIGVLCVGDLAARKLSPELQNHLRTLAHQVVTNIELQLLEARLREGQAIARMGSWEQDITNNQLFWSEELFSVLDFPREDGPPSQEAFVSRIHPDDLERAIVAHYTMLQNASSFSTDLRFVRRDGSTRWMHCRGQAITDREGKVLKAVGTTMDITERKEYEEALRVMEEKHHLTHQRLESTLNQARLGTFCRDVETGQYIELSDTWYALFGIPKGTLATLSDFLQRVHPDDQPLVERSIQETQQHREGYEAEYRILRPDGSLRWLHTSAVPLYNAEGTVRYLSGVTQDITEQKEIEAERERALFEAQERADRDPLTNLLNHRAFHKRLYEETERAQRERRQLAVVMFDTDNFKFFNDVYGHAIGDEVLQLIARRLEAICRPYDILARFGGDEFALLMPGVAIEAEALEERLLQALQGLVYQPMGQSVGIPLTLSLGLVLFPDRTADRTLLIPLADEQLRRAKTGAERKNEAYCARALFQSQVEGFSMLDALVTAVDNKDRYTRRHSEDVLSYCLQIARELDLDSHVQQTLSVAALLHDVGKIGVPDSILRKPGALTASEFAVVQQHAEMGAAIVSAVPGLGFTLECIRHHHERWDGRGYPSGLEGEQIPFLARLMAVADAFSAMTTDRPYRQGMPAARALRILEEGAGVQWDAELVHAFLTARAVKV
jgi:diguanylate cyclase (GGDEF)-like protein/PAS domain S-box-containing protein